MNFWKEIESNLWNEGFEVMNENDSIEWHSEKGSHRIDLKNIAINKDKLAWYQDEEYGRCWVKIKYPDGIILNWRPFSNHSDFGFNFHFIKWFNDRLLIIYTENKTGVTDIIEIDKLKVETLYSGNISEIQIENSLIFIKNNSEFIQIINLSFGIKESEKLNLHDFKLKFPNVEMKSLSYFFMNYETDYNKNYS